MFKIVLENLHLPSNSSQEHLPKSQHWNSVKFTGSTTMSNQTIVGDWDSQAANFFAKNLGTDESIRIRIGHSFRELEGLGMIYITPSKGLGCTSVGAELQKLISN